jgi:hypothetical protein
MAILDGVLAEMVAGLRGELAGAGLTRQRGGIARGVAWAEASGRAPDGSWLELRLHHRPTDRRLDGGLLAYQPVARGGRTVVIGERTLEYALDASEMSAVLTDEVARWLRVAGERRAPEPDPDEAELSLLA